MAEAPNDKLYWLAVLSSIGDMTTDILLNEAQEETKRQRQGIEQDRWSEELKLEKEKVQNDKEYKDNMISLEYDKLEIEYGDMVSEHGAGNIETYVENNVTKRRVKTTGYDWQLRTDWLQMNEQGKINMMNEFFSEHDHLIQPEDMDEQIAVRSAYATGMRTGSNFTMHQIIPEDQYLGADGAYVGVDYDSRDFFGVNDISQGDTFIQRMYRKDSLTDMDKQILTSLGFFSAGELDKWDINKVNQLKSMWTGFKTGAMSGDNANFYNNDQMFNRKTQMEEKFLQNRDAWFNSNLGSIQMESVKEMQTLLQPLTTENGQRMTEINFLKANGKLADYDYMSTHGQKKIRGILDERKFDENSKNIIIDYFVTKGSGALSTPFFSKLANDLTPKGDIRAGSQLDTIRKGLNTLGIKDFDNLLKAVKTQQTIDKQIGNHSDFLQMNYDNMPAIAQNRVKINAIFDINPGLRDEIHSADDKTFEKAKNKYIDLARKEGIPMSVIGAFLKEMLKNQQVLDSLNAL